MKNTLYVSCNEAMVNSVAVIELCLSKNKISQSVSQYVVSQNIHLNKIL